MKINGNLGFSTLGSAELRNAVIERLPTLPVTVIAGRIVYNTTDGTYYYYSGATSSWIAIANAASITALQIELDAFESAVGSCINANGTFNPSAFNGFNHVSGLTSSSTIVDVLSQIDAAIVGASPSLVTLSDTNIVSPVNGQVLFFDSASSFWKNNTLSSLSDGDLLRWNSTTNNWDNIPSSGLGASSFGILFGDSGTASADNATDSISIVGPSGSGILTTASDNPEVLSIKLDVSKLTAMLDPVVLADELVIRDISAGTTLRSSLTKVVNDLNIPNGTITNGVIARIGSGTYTSRSVAVAGAGTLAGLAITDGDAVSGNPTLGLDIANTTALVGTVDSTDSLIMLDTSSSSNRRVTLAGLTASITAFVDVTGDTMTGVLSMGGNIITNVSTPTTGTDVANKAYVDSIAAGLHWKQSVRVSTTTDIALNGIQTLDGVLTVVGDRVLVKNQVTQSDNGLYLVAAGSWSRTTDFDSISPIDEINGAAVFVREGIIYADTGWVVTSDVTVVGTSPINWTEFTTGGIGTITLNDLLDVTIGAPAAGESLVYDGAIWSNKKTQHIYDSTLNGGPTTTHVIMHNLDQQFVNVTVYSDTFEQIIPNTVSLDSNNQTSITFTSSINCTVVISGVPGVVPS